MLREIAAAGADIQAIAYEGAGEASDIAEVAEQKIYAVRHGREVQGLSPIKSIIMDVYNRLDELSQSESGLPGLPTGFHDLDRRLTGLNKSDLILIAAPSRYGPRRRSPSMSRCMRQSIRIKTSCCSSSK